MRLQEWFSKNCVNISSFARKAGVSPPVIYKALKRPLNITLHSAHKICKATAYQVELQDLIVEDNKKGS